MSVLQNITIRELDERLNLTQEDILSSLHRNLPHGVPVLHSHNACLLHQHDYVMGYSASHRMALWTAYTLGDSDVGSYL